MEASWTTREQDGQRTIVHDNRWLAVIGVPIAIAGLAVAIGPWLIESARESGGWPILAVGSLIGSGIVVAGLSMCLKYEEFTADRGQGTLVQHFGLRPFRRTRTCALKDFNEVACVTETMPGSSSPGSSVHHRLRLMGPDQSVLLASALDTAPILAEAERWASFLELPLQNRMGATPETQLRERMTQNRPGGG